MHPRNEHQLLLTVRANSPVISGHDVAVMVGQAHAYQVAFEDRANVCIMGDLSAAQEVMTDLALGATPREVSCPTNLLLHCFPTSLLLVGPGLHTVQSARCGCPVGMTRHFLVRSVLAIHRWPTGLGAHRLVFRISRFSHIIRACNPRVLMPACNPHEGPCNEGPPPAEPSRLQPV